MAVVNSVYIFSDLVDLSKLQEIYLQKNRAKMFTHRLECPADKATQWMLFENINLQGKHLLHTSQYLLQMTHNLR